MFKRCIKNQSIIILTFMLMTWYFTGNSSYEKTKCYEKWSSPKKMDKKQRQNWIQRIATHFILFLFCSQSSREHFFGVCMYDCITLPLSHPRCDYIILNICVQQCFFIIIMQAPSVVHNHAYTFYSDFGEGKKRNAWKKN